MGKKGESGIKILKMTDNNYMKHVEASIRNGIPCLLENIGIELDPALEPILQKQIVVKGASKTIKLGDSVIEYNDNF